MATKKAYAWQKQKDIIKSQIASKFRQERIDFEKEIYKRFDETILKSGDYETVAEKYKITDIDISTDNVVFEDTLLKKIDEILEMDEISSSIEITKLWEEKPSLLFSEKLTNHLAENYKFINNEKSEEYFLENINNHPQSLFTRNRYAEFLHHTKRDVEIIKAYGTINIDEIVPDRKIFTVLDFYDACLYLGNYLTLTKNKKKAREYVTLLEGTYYNGKAFTLLRKNMNFFSWIVVVFFGIMLFLIKFPFLLLLLIIRGIIRLFRVATDFKLFAHIEQWLSDKISTI